MSAQIDQIDSVGIGIEGTREGQQKETECGGSPDAFGSIMG